MSEKLFRNVSEEFSYLNAIIGENEFRSNFSILNAVIIIIVQSIIMPLHYQTRGTCYRYINFLRGAMTLLSAEKSHNF